MPEKVPPVVSRKFYGINTWGNPLERTPGSAVVLENFRVMPDFWLRLRSGRKARMFGDANSAIRKIHTFRDSTAAGSSAHLIQRVTGNTVEWKRFTVSPWVLDPFTTATISTSYGGSFTTTAAAPSCNLRDKAVLYNGLGVRDGTNSRPPFWSYDPQLRYFGLDAYCPNGNPSVAFSPGEGYNSCQFALKIFVGLHNASTGHYSNGVYAGTIPATTATGTITVSELSRLKVAYRDTFERSELFYVFYATIDGGSVPYQILDSSLTDVYRVAVTSTSASLSIKQIGNGWILNLDAEMPTDNHPPKPMRSIAYVNSRMYGVLKGGGGGGEASTQLQPDGSYKRDFSYVPGDNYQTGLVYSKSASDIALKPNQIGNPEESWPLTYFTAAPNAEVPIKVAAAPDDVRILAITATRSFLVTEAADGFHEWKCVGKIHGIAREECWVETPWGSIWLTQRNQVARIDSGYEEVSIISNEYDSAVRGKSALFGTYVADPINEVDQVRFYFDDGTCLVHDFALRTPQFVHGQGYVFTDQNYTAGATITASDDSVYHLMAARHLYSVEGQPDESGRVVTYDEDFGSTVDTLVKSTFSGYWLGQEDDFGDDTLRKNIFEAGIDGDAEFTFEWYPDRVQVNSFTKREGVNKKRISQTDADSMIQSWTVQLEKANYGWFRFGIRLTSDHLLNGNTYPGRDEAATVFSPLFGSIARLRAYIGMGQNRK